ncbi:MAG: hypothetical protein K2J79_03540 [Ruminiclostridium sp.]|nr:hypothetical protein [Ruminiclostridium sp.]
MAINKLGDAYQNPIKYTPNKTVSENKQAKSLRTDILTLTQEAQEYLARTSKTNKSEKSGQEDLLNKETNKNDQEKSNSMIEFEFFTKQLEEAKENKGGNRIQDLAKCMKIARRIMHGDRVPLKDHKFLAEKFPELYKNSLMFKQHNPEPKKYKSVLSKEDEENGQEQSVSQLDSAENMDSLLADALEDLGE